MGEPVLNDSIESPEKIGYDYFVKAYHQSNNDSLKASLFNYYMALEYYKLAGKKEQISSCYKNIGVLFDHCGFHKKSLEFFKKALKIIEVAAPGNRSHAGTLRNIARQFRYLKKYDSSYYYYIKSKAAFLNLNDIKKVATIENEIGLLYVGLEKFEDGRKQYLKSMKLDTSTYRKSVAFNNIGDSYLNSKDTATALEYFNQALEYYYASNASKTKISLCLQNISECYFSDSKIRVEFLEKALEYETDIDLQHHILILLSSLYEDRQMNSELRKSLLDIRNIGEKIKERKIVFDLKFQTMQMEYALLEIKNTELQQERQTDANTNKNTLLMISAVFVALIVLFYVNQKRRKVQGKSYPTASLPHLG